MSVCSHSWDTYSNFWMSSSSLFVVLLLFSQANKPTAFHDVIEGHVTSFQYTHSICTSATWIRYGTAMRQKDMLIYVYQPASSEFTSLPASPRKEPQYFHSRVHRSGAERRSHLKDAKGAGRKPYKDKLLIHSDEHHRQCFVQTLIISFETCYSLSLCHQLRCLSHPPPPPKCQQTSFCTL